MPPTLTLSTFVFVPFRSIYVCGMYNKLYYTHTQQKQKQTCHSKERDGSRRFFLVASSVN